MAASTVNVQKRLKKKQSASAVYTYVYTASSTFYM